MLSIGDQGESVLFLQESLNKLLPSAIREDGIFGSETERAVKDFQRNTGIQIDGIVGPITSQKLVEELDKLNGIQSITPVSVSQVLSPEPEVKLESYILPATILVMGGILAYSYYNN